MDYLIIVNDNGELKKISATEIDQHNAKAGAAFEAVINTILDLRSLQAELDFGNDDGDTPVGIIGGVR